MNIKSKKNQIDFYDKCYKIIQQDITPWYTFVLPELIKLINSNSKLLEIGCGQSQGLRYLVKNKFLREENIYGIDQSSGAISFSSKELPLAKLSVGDAYALKFVDNSFDFILLMETIEHIEHPDFVLEEIYRVLKFGGKVFISFPNYINFPWLIIRIFAEKLNKPSWINLQPIDKIYTTFDIIGLCNRAGLSYNKCIGSNYFPPILYKYENEYITKFFNVIGLNHLAFHPVLVFQK